MRTSALILVLWACVLLGSASVPPLVVHKAQKAQHYQTAPANTQRDSQLQNPRAATKATEKQGKIAKPKWYQDPQWLTVIILSVYTGATIIYAVFAGLQLNALRRQTVLAYRPRLIIRHIVVAHPDLRGRFDKDLAKVPLFDSQLSIVNIGGTRATIKGSGLWFRMIRGELPSVPPYYGEASNNPMTVGAMVEPGESRFVRTDCRNEVVEGGETAIQSVAGEPRPMYLHALGYVEYIDPNRIARRTGFCRRWEERTQRFLPVDNPDYEYTD